jgi:hypothetical protein
LDSQGFTPARTERSLLLGLSGLAFFLEWIPNLLGGYGYFIDELYYLACARRLDFGYVDHPPLAPLLLWINTAIGGDSIASIRFLPAIAGAATVFLSGWLAARLGGKRYAQALAAIAAMFAGILLIFFSIFTMNAFEVLIWTGCFAIIITMIQRDEPRLWLAFGALAGIGLQNKHTIVLLSLGILVGLALTPGRKYLATRWLWLGGLLAFVIFLPNLLWQVEHEWQSLEFYRNASSFKNLPTPAWKAVLNQILFMNPGAFPVWIAGLGFFLFSRKGRRLQFAAWTYLLLLALLIASQSSRPDRMAGLYPVLFAGGAVFFQDIVQRERWRWLGAAMIVLVLAAGAVFAPLGLPILPPERLARYATFLGVDTRIERGEGKLAELPQWFADRFGWEELVAQVAHVFQDLPPEERARAIVLAPSYGHAGAIELLGSPYGLPPVVSPQNTYHLWGKDVLEQESAEVIISIGMREALIPIFEEVQQVALYECEFCINWRNHMPIYVARRPKLSSPELREAWEEFKHYE